MLRINPQDAILFSKMGNEMVGTVDIINIIQTPVTYKVGSSNNLLIKHINNNFPLHR